MTMFSPEAGEELLDRTGLQGEYKRVEPVIDGSSRHCGICGAAFTTVAGARVAICDQCGHELDVGSAEWPCGTCGGLVTLPAAATESVCPYCKGWVSRVGR
jgi:DNA-directed RNA polymerase subunit RPC12/RpoP